MSDLLVPFLYELRKRDGLTAAVSYLSREGAAKPPRFMGNPRNAP